MLPTRMLVLQPTPFCNINCDYCYLRQRSQRGVMTESTVEAVAGRIVRNIDPELSTLVVWHGGEPTTVPLRWYRSAYQILNAGKRGRPMQYSVQTNGIGMNDEWARFFSESTTHVGVSLDGPEDLHDVHRRTRNGKPTWYRVMRAIDVLRRNNVAVGIITVLTVDSLHRADDLVDFYASHGLHDISFSIEEREGANITTSLDVPNVERTMEQFLLQFMLRVIDRKLPIRVREVERILGLMATDGNAIGANEQTEPLAIITADYSGGVYTYSPEFTEHATGGWAHLRLGNVHRDSTAEIFKGPALRRLTREVNAGLARCAKECGFWTICGGGSPVNRLAEQGTLDVAETQFCRLTVQATARALHRLLTADGARPD
jgi:uncharacterized protein